MTEPAPEEPQYDTHEMATRVVYELLGRRWVWPRMQVVDVYPFTRDVILTGRPVQQIIQVTGPNGQPVAEEDYVLHGGFRLRFTSSLVHAHSAIHCQVNPEVHVEYIYGSPPPEQIKYAIDILDDEFQKAIEGSDECQLPKRVTNVSRQGMSMTILDPQKFIDEGRTGIPEVDFAINVFNPSRAKTRARLFTQSNPPARRLSAVALPE